MWLVRTGIALGSNLGDRLAHLRTALAAICALPHVSEPVLASAIYETAPVDSVAGAEAFLNAVVEVEFIGEPLVFLRELRTIETSLGRPPQRARNAPRTMDLDLLYVGNLTLADPELVLPHPRLHERWFVLAPLAEIRSDLVLPNQRCSIAELLALLPQVAGNRRLSDHWKA